MSNVYESSFYKSPQITNIIKFLALEMIISKNNPNKIILLELPVELNEIVRGYCSKSKIYFELKKQKKRKFNIRFIKTSIFLKGLLFYFRKLFTNLLSFNNKADYFPLIIFANPIITEKDCGRLKTKTEKRENHAVSIVLQLPHPI